MNDEERLFHIIHTAHLLNSLLYKYLLSHMNTTTISYNPQTRIIPRSLSTKMLLTWLFFILSFRMILFNNLNTSWGLLSNWKGVSHWDAMLWTCPFWLLFTSLSRPIIKLSLSICSYSFQPNVTAEFNDCALISSSHHYYKLFLSATQRSYSLTLRCWILETVFQPVLHWAFRTCRSTCFLTRKCWVKQHNNFMVKPECITSAVSTCWKSLSYFQKQKLDCLDMIPSGHFSVLCFLQDTCKLCCNCQAFLQNLLVSWETICHLTLFFLLKVW